MIKAPVSRTRLVRFDTFELDVGSGELRRAGVRLNLQEQPLHLLTALLERPGKLVTRGELRHRLWPADTFVDFEHGLNAAVKRLRDALGDSADTPRYVETVPRRGYRFVAPVALVGESAGDTGPVQTPAPVPIGPRPPAETPALQPRHGWRPLGVGATAIILLALGVAWLSRTSGASPGSTPAMRVVALTTMNGFENGEISPNGRQVAFEWNGEREDNWDIYVKFVGSSEMRRLTTDPAPDVAPSWSHDGRLIAYVRATAGYPPQKSGHVRVVSAIGGADRQISDFLIGGKAQWSPDDRYLVAGREFHTPFPFGSAIATPQNVIDDPDAGIYVIPLQGGEPRVLTRSRPQEVYSAQSFSPDGHRLAYISFENRTLNTSQLYVLEVDSSFAAVGAPLQLTRHETTTWIKGVTWSQDGRSLIYAADDMRSSVLWRVNIDGRTPPERIEMAGGGVGFPSVPRTGDRLAFSRYLQDQDIYKVVPGRPSEPVARSSTFEGNVQFSSDGRRIAFCSDRSGGDSQEVWVANADGSAPEQLTHGPGAVQCSPTWSPDGEHVAFDSQAADGSWHIWTVDREGGSLRSVIDDPGDQNHPTWSRDGHWIYFAWRQPAEPDFFGREIWRARVETGVKERVTEDGRAVVARESVDGTTLIYRAAMPTGPLLAKPLAGGPARTLIACVTATAFSVTKMGIYYLPCQSTPVTTPIVHLLDPATGSDREAGGLENYTYARTPGGFTVSPDGHTILYERQVRSGSNLMMIENFK